MRFKTFGLLLFAVVLLAPVAQAAEVAGSEVVPDLAPQAELAPAEEPVPDVVEPLPCENPEPLFQDSTQCHLPCTQQSHCIGVCPGGADGECWRAFGFCGGSSIDKYCNCF